MIEAKLVQLNNILHAAEVIKNLLRSLDVMLPTPHCCRQQMEPLFPASPENKTVGIKYNRQ